MCDKTCFILVHLLVLLHFILVHLLVLLHFILVHLLVLLHKFKYFTEYLDNIGVDEIYILFLKSYFEGNVGIACHDMWEFESRVQAWRNRIKEWKTVVKQADTAPDVRTGYSRRCVLNLTATPNVRPCILDRVVSFSIVTTSSHGSS
jgi:hypothetical protein